MARVRAAKSPRGHPARAGWRSSDEYTFLEDSRYTSQQENMRRVTFPRPAASQRQRGAASAQALDGDELVARGSARGRRHRAGDLLALDLAERRRFHVVAGLAIGGGNRHAAARARGETAVDAVAVGIVGDDERTPFGLRRSAEKGSREDERGEQIPHP